MKTLFQYQLYLKVETFQEVHSYNLEPVFQKTFTLPETNSSHLKRWRPRNFIWTNHWFGLFAVRFREGKLTAQFHHNQAPFILSNIFWLVVEPTHLKIWSSNWKSYEIFPRDRGQNKCLKPPPNILQCQSQDPDYCNDSQNLSQKPRKRTWQWKKQQFEWRCISYLKKIRVFLGPSENWDFLLKISPSPEALPHLANTFAMSSSEAWYGRFFTKSLP